VVACLRRTDTTLNLGECTLHSGACQIKVGGKLGKGCVGGSRSSAGDPRMQSARLQKLLL
jgi:hypothetical protein